MWRWLQGHRDYSWAWAATASARHHVLIRRSLSDPSELAFFYCHAPAGRPVSLPVLITVAGKRWPAEECHQQGKGQAGLDGHQVRLWHSFHRHTVLSMSALALLAAAAARPLPTAPLPQATGAIPAATPAQPPAWADTGILPASADQPPPGDPGMVKVSVPEARRLTLLATTPMTAAARQVGYVTIEPLDAGQRSRVTMALDFKAHGIVRLLLPLVVRRQARKQLPKNQQRLKEVLERGA